MNTIGSIECLTHCDQGWHNWHHKYPFDYATSEFGVSSQFNASKLVIDALAAVGLVWGRKRATGMWSKLTEKQQQAKIKAST